MVTGSYQLLHILVIEAKVYPFDVNSSLGSACYNLSLKMWTYAPCI